MEIKKTAEEDSGQKKKSDSREDYIRASLALSMIPSVGAGRIRKLFEHFSDPMAVFSKKWEEIAEVPSIGVGVARSIHHFRKWNEVDRVLMMTAKHRMKLITPADRCYPFRLRHIYDPPAILWIKGDPNSLKNEFIAVVGTRRPSATGRELTITLTRAITEAVHAGIVSGLAHGIDTLAHKVTLEQCRCTVAVLGCGLDRVYPAGNRRLAHDILNSGGALISEYPPGTKPDAHHFPVRNRVVSGMSLGVVVMETGINGGSMITVGQALEQGREVFAVPHDIRNERGEGCNIIIQRGWGKLICNAEDVAAELPAAIRAACYEAHSVDGLEASRKRGRAQNNKRVLNPLQQKIVTLLEVKILHIDALSRQIGSATHNLLPVLLQLELEGVIEQRPGKKFALRE